MSTLLFLAAIAVLQDPQITISKRKPVSYEAKLQTEAWQKALRSLSQEVGGNLIFEVNLKMAPPAFDVRSVNEDELWLVAAASRTDYERINEASCFFRESSNSNKQLADQQRAILHWIQSLLTRAKNGDIQVPSENMPKDVQQAFFSQVVRSRPDLLRGALSGTKDLNVHISMYPRVSYIDPTTGRRNVISLLSEEPRIEPPNRKTPKMSNPIVKPVNSPLDFEKGSCLSVEEFVKRGSTAFGRSFSLDPRVADRLIFASGKITSDAFKTVLARLTTVVPSQEKFDARGFAEERKTLLSEITENLFKGQKVGGFDSSEFAAGRQVMASEISEKFPAVAEVFKKIGLSGNATLKLSSGIEVSVNVGGTGTSLGSMKTPSGNTIPVYLSPCASVIIVP